MACLEILSRNLGNDPLPPLLAGEGQGGGVNLILICEVRLFDHANGLDAPTRGSVSWAAAAQCRARPGSTVRCTDPRNSAGKCGWCPAGARALAFDKSPASIETPGSGMLERKLK
jgi:hypothetical protein